jgi:hypothetical protein
LPILHDRMSQAGPFMGRRGRRSDNLMRYPATTCDTTPHRLNALSLHCAQNGSRKGLPSFKGEYHENSSQDAKNPLL